MAIFNSYVSLPEGTIHPILLFHVSEARSCVGGQSCGSNLPAALGFFWVDLYQNGGANVDRRNVSEKGVDPFLYPIKKGQTKNMFNSIHSSVAPHSVGIPWDTHSSLAPSIHQHAPRSRVPTSRVHCWVCNSRLSPRCAGCYCCCAPGPENINNNI